jgi:hypothetical protein
MSKSVIFLFALLIATTFAHAQISSGNARVLRQCAQDFDQ